MKKELAADMIIHLGDGASEMFEMTEYTVNKLVYTVKGNCDSAVYGFPEQQILICGSKKIFACHGHTQSVKYGLSNLFCTGRENNCDICLFGHTHLQCCEYSGGLYLINPGAVKNGEYCVIEIKNNRINLVFRRL